MEPALRRAGQAIKISTLNGAAYPGREPERDKQQVRWMEIVFEDGVGFDPAKLFESMKGEVGLNRPPASQPVAGRAPGGSRDGGHGGRGTVVGGAGGQPPQLSGRALPAILVDCAGSPAPKSRKARCKIDWGRLSGG
ncbi:hypothetical protein [Hymenobacter sp.]|uniref:hypothetical protein n=1 Tax=Hymenobacter sp. TaxID=1898978 RepID=UPI00286C5CD9|nr:hypothetical protein [Hymenobacter sp.]